MPAPAFANTIHNPQLAQALRRARVIAALPLPYFIVSQMCKLRMPSPSFYLLAPEGVPVLNPELRRRLDDVVHRLTNLRDSL